MRLLADQDVYWTTVLFLRSAGHDVQTAQEAGLAEAEDEVLLNHCVAAARGLVLVTRILELWCSHVGCPVPALY